MNKREALRAEKRIAEAFPHLMAEPYESSSAPGGWAVEVKQRRPWKTDLWTVDEVRNFMPQSSPVVKRLPKTERED